MGLDYFGLLRIRIRTGFVLTKDTPQDAFVNSGRHY